MPQSNVSLTVYNQGTALVQDRRTFTLQAGENVVNFTDVAAEIVPTSVVLKSLTDASALTVMEQNYVYDLVNQSALMQRYLDERIELVTQDGTAFSGELLSGRGDAIILRAKDGKVIVVRPNQIRDLRFPSLPGGLITRPTLRWLLWSAAAGEQRVELTYLTGGIGWSADYNLLLNADKTALDLNGWVTLNNTSGTAYHDAQLKLIAGDVNRIQYKNSFNDEMLLGDFADMDLSKQVTEREFFEYHLYAIMRPVTMGDNETKQIEFVVGSRIPANTYYTYAASPSYSGHDKARIFNQHYSYRANVKVQIYLQFSTAKENGLGAQLPAGHVRVYQSDIDGSALLIGENFIDHTPEGEIVNLYLGNAFDLVGERIQTAFERQSEWRLEESYEIRLRNRKERDTVEIRVPETLFRWSNWEILNATHTYEKIDSHTIEFRASVAPQGETVIRYTVRYTWPK